MAPNPGSANDLGTADGVAGAVGVVTVPPTAAVAADLVVTAAGSFNSEIGCPGDWQPDCQAAQLSKRSRSVAIGTRTTGWAAFPAGPTPHYPLLPRPR